MKISTTVVAVIALVTMMASANAMRIGRMSMAAAISKTRSESGRGGLGAWGLNGGRFIGSSPGGSATCMREW
jgi:hypothetical protein